MAAVLESVTFDCVDAHALARFWAEVLGWNIYFDDDPVVVVAPAFPYLGPGPSLLFIPVPEARTVKNRVHLDVSPTDRTRDEEVARLVELGASVVSDHRTDGGAGWVWMADPEGNDFCVVRSPAERELAPKRYFVEARTE